MSKLDKSQYTKEEWKKIREIRRIEKDHGRNKKTSIPTAIESIQKTAFVLGNGTSRSTIQLKDIHRYGPIYACNAVYRDYAPDYLIAVDTKMILEIVKSGYQNTHQVWTNQHKVFNNIENLNYFNPSKGWSSGPTALNMASEHGFQEIYILGFDYEGLDKKVNNIFADTPNYKRSIDRATYFGNWLRQTYLTIEKFPQIRYIRVIPKGGMITDDLRTLKNLHHIEIEEFKKRFGISSK